MSIHPPPYNQTLSTFFKLISLSFLLTLFSATIQADERSDIRFEMDRQGALIKSMDDLEEYLHGDKEAASPLYLLSDEGINELLDSLRFGNDGLASLNIQPLERELTPTESYAVLELFGLQNLVFHMDNDRVETDTDNRLNFCGGNFMPFDGEHQSLSICDGDYLHGYECAGVGTCRRAGGRVCHPPSCK